MADVRPLVTFADAQAAAAGALRDALATRAEPYAQGVQVGTRVPANRSAETPHLPLLVVRKDTDAPHPSMANARCTIRVTAWHTGADEAHDLAQLAQGLLYVHSGAVIRGVRPATGPIATVDDESGVDLAYFTVTANVRPTVLT